MYYLLLDKHHLRLVQKIHHLSFCQELEKESIPWSEEPGTAYQTLPR